jgi:DNA-binding transcriptional MerR regulator
MKFIGETIGFQAKEVCAFSGLQYRRLDNWAKTGFIVPSLAASDADKKRFRYYSFTDIVALTVARKLRDTGFSMAALRRIKTMLAQDYQDPLWAHAWIISDGHDLFELRHDRHEILSLLKHPGQSCMPITVLDVACTAEELVAMAAKDLQKTRAEVRDLIARGIESRTVACNADSVA